MRVRSVLIVTLLGLLLAAVLSAVVISLGGNEPGDRDPLVGGKGGAGSSGVGPAEPARRGGSQRGGPAEPAGDARTQPEPDEPPARAPETFPVAGRVTDARGRGLERATVEVAGQRVTTDGQGRFNIPGVAVGRQTVTAWAKGYLLKSVDIRVPDASQELRLSSFRTASGIVRFPDGEPAAGVRVVVSTRVRGESFAVETTTDAEGRYTVERMPPGRLHVQVESFKRDGTPFVRTHGKRAGTHAEVTLREGTLFLGRVLAPDGSPVAGAAVSVLASRDKSSGVAHSATSDEEGHFELIVRTGTRYSLHVETPTDDVTGWRFPRWFRHEVTGGGEAVEAVLEAGHEIAGRVTGSIGAVAGRKLDVYRVAGNNRGFLTRATIQADGTFRVGGLWKAKYELRLEKTDDNDPWIIVRPRVFSTGTNDAAPKVVRGRPISGVLVDADGVAMEAAWLQVVSMVNEGTRRAKTDANGRFTFGLLPPGTWELRLLGRKTGPVAIGKFEAGVTGLRAEAPADSP